MHGGADRQVRAAARRRLEEAVAEALMRGWLKAAEQADMTRDGETRELLGLPDPAAEITAQAE